MPKKKAAKKMSQSPARRAVPSHKRSTRPMLTVTFDEHSIERLDRECKAQGISRGRMLDAMIHAWCGEAGNVLCSEHGCYLAVEDGPTCPLHTDAGEVA